MQKRMRYLFKQLATYLSVSITIYDALCLIEKRQKVRDSKFKKTLASLRKDISEGLSVTLAFEKLQKDRYVDTISLSIIRSAERAGNLRVGFQKVSLRLEKIHSKDSQLLSKALYPVIVSVSSVVLAYILVLMIFPKILPLFYSLKVPIPRTTQLALSAVQFISRNIIYLIAGMLAGGALFSYVYHVDIRYKTLVHQILTGIPVVGQILFARDSTQACHSIALLLKSDIPIAEAISIARRDIFAEQYRIAFMKVEEQLLVGKGIAETLQQEKYYASTLWPDFVLIGERTGRLPQAFEDLGQVYEQELDSVLDKLTVLAEPILLVVVASVVLFIALSVIQPMYSIIQYVHP